ncbi:MAG: beta-N-acetylhexosaminidase [Steroidobacteraceae bacterium]|nr:beta-N-acetylhexosaminidase [Steroidobacteraceae bacterium]
MTLGPLMIDVAGRELTPEDREILKHPLVGGVILFTRNYADPAQLRALVAAIHGLRSPPLIVAVDHEGGRVQRFRSGFSVLPAARRIGQEFDLNPKAGLDLARHMGWLMAAELRACGVDLSFAPCVDLDYGVSEVIGDRAFHATAQAVSQLASAYMHGMRDAGMAATAKHFPGHGAVVADSHVASPVDRRELVDMEDDLAPYRRLIANGLPGVLVSHVLFPAVDDSVASVSPYWIREVLRGDLGFKGAVFTDDMSMAGAAVAGDIVVRSRRALAAGCDMVLICNSRPSAIAAIDGLGVDPEPASHARLVRMRGREAPSLETLQASAQWRECQNWLARCAATPSLTLEAGRA